LRDTLLADVVQQRGEVEHLAVTRVETVQRLGLVEQLECELGDMLRVREIRVAPAREARNRRAPQCVRISRTSRRDRAC
jgi:hypothetical protein